MKYFGTDFSNKVHGRWIITDEGLTPSTASFYDLPFHPECLTNNLRIGESSYYQGGGYTVIAISGSPIDKRPGSTSVFWTKEILTRDEMLIKMKNNKIVMKIINSIQQ